MATGDAPDDRNQTRGSGWLGNRGLRTVDAGLLIIGWLVTLQILSCSWIPDSGVTRDLTKRPVLTRTTS